MARGAFTLVEMLVAVGLVVLMMTLFATIFQMATGAMSTQKGLAENDQRVRLVMMRLRNDLNGNKSDANDPNRPYRTFRNVVPFGPDEIDGTTTPSADRLGFFYISENDPNDDTDDVLHFTVFMPTGSPERYTGRAAVVLPDVNGNYGLPPGNPNPINPQPVASYPPAQPTPPAQDPLQAAVAPLNGQQYWPNQPEFDDIQGVPNLAGSSPVAEVCYFLRRGTLYRRVMLIRQPNISPPAQAPDGTPTDAGLKNLKMTPIYGVPFQRNFWTDFDYAAYFDARTATPGLRFHGTGLTSQRDSLSNSPSPGFANPFVLGNPAYRFGFDSTTVGVNPSATYGQPREFVTSGGNPYFIGRFTQAETSDPTFGYPGYLPAVNPMNSLTPLNYNTTTGAVTNYSGPRAGEDVLMTNVIKFDIKVFDPAASFGPDGLPGVGGFDDDNDGNPDFLPNGNPDLKELGWPGSDDGDFRDIGHNGSTGYYSATDTRNVPITMYYSANNSLGQNSFQNIITANLNALPVPPHDYTYPNANYSNPAFNKNRYDTWNPTLNLGNTKDSHGNLVSECPPFRPFNYGPDGRPGQANYDDDGDGNPDFYQTGPNKGLPDLKELGWPNTDDQPVALGAIQIKITFYDRTSKQVREATMVQSLLYTP